VGRERKISRADVLDAAFGQIAEGGLDSLSMRGLGQRLGVEAMALYRYVGSKDELVGHLRAELFRGVPIQMDSGRPRRDLEQLCLGARRALTAKPGAHALLAGMQWSFDELNVRDRTVGRNSATTVRLARSGTQNHEEEQAGATWLPLAEAMLRSLKGLVPEVLDRAYAFRVLFCYLLGQVVFAGTSRAAYAQVDSAHSGEFPEFWAVAGSLAESSFEIEFELGLRALLDAMEQRSAF